MTDHVTGTLTILAALVIAAPLAMPQDTFVEGFDGGSNEGGWAWGTGNETTSPLNGNPGAYLKDLTLFTAVPVLGSGGGVTSPFTGDYVVRGVTSIGVDLNTLDKQLAVESNRFLTLVLLDDSGTPNNPNDDRGAYFVGDTVIPDAGVPIDTPAGWTSFDFEINSQSALLPPGWQSISFAGPPLAWSELMSSVDLVEFWYGVPGTIFLFDSWDVGADNLRITAGSCQADLGFGGPGNLALSLCSATLVLEGAPAFSPVFLAVGTTNSPTPFKGGTLVPVPPLAVIQVTAGAQGGYSAHVPAGGGPASIFVQAAAPDATLPGGFAISNALQVELLP